MTCDEALGSSLILANTNLKDGEEGLGEIIKCASFGHRLIKVEFASEELHAQQGENNDEEEEQQQQGGDGLHGVEQGGHQVTKRRPVTEEDREFNSPSFLFPFFLSLFLLSYREK